MTPPDNAHTPHPLVLGGGGTVASSPRSGGPGLLASGGEHLSEGLGASWVTPTVPAGS